MKTKTAWQEIKRDVQDHMQGRYKKDKKIYTVKGINQDVDWRFCIEQPEKKSNLPYYFLQHVNPHTKMLKLTTKRDTKNCYVSKTFKDHKADWDYLVRFRDRIFKEQGFTSKTPVFEKMREIARHIAIYHHRISGEYLHPIDVVTHAGWCTGKSAAVIAVAHTMGLEARAIIWFGHTTAEIKIDGKWCFCENIPEKGGEEFNYLFRKSWMEIVANPDACKELTSKVQREYYKNVCNFFDHLYVYSIGINWHMSSIGTFHWVRLNPYTAKALYPEVDITKMRSRYFASRYGKSRGSGANWVWGGMNWDENSGWDSLRFVRVNPGQGIRKSVYISSLKRVKKITCHITLVKNIRINLKSDNWHIRVNGGKKHYLKDLKCRLQYSGDVLFHNFPWWVVDIFKDNEKFMLKPNAAIKTMVDEDRLPNNHIKNKTKYVINNFDVKWKWHKGSKKENQLCFDLPKEEIRAKSVNTIELLSDPGESKEYFNVRLVDNPFLPRPRPVKK